MYDINRRAYFTTLGELRMLLKDFPNDTKVCTIGVWGSYLHIESDNSLISFDDEGLIDDYDELEDEEFFYRNTTREEEEHSQRITQLGLDPKEY